MCGRFALSAEAEAIALAFEVALAGPYAPRYNIAPSQPLLIIRREEAARRAAFVTWGLLPAWSRDPVKGARPINARAETVASKPSFRAAFRHRRCLVPASGYFEWQATASGKQPWYMSPADGSVFALAGIWEHWEHDGSVIETCALLTCAANSTLAAVHDRMPVVIERADYARWLDPQVQPAAVETLLAPAAEDRFVLRTVSRRVNSPLHDDAECVAAVDA